MEENINKQEQRAYIVGMYDEQKYADVMPRDRFDAMLDSIVALDDAFMRQSGVYDGAVYDDEAAYEYLYEELQKQYPDYQMYCMRFADDYMEFCERYLDSVGAIDWE